MPRIAYVSRWGQTCGISTYTEQLATAVCQAGYDVRVYGPSLAYEGEQGGVVRKLEGIPVEYVWRSDQHGGNAHVIPQLVTRDKIDVVHFQHEFGLFCNDEDFIHTVRATREAGARVVVTVHTVWPYGSYQHRSGWFERVARSADVVVTHTPAAQASVAVASGGKGHVVLVPHGTPEERQGHRGRGRNVLELPKRVTNPILVQGFIGPGKNLFGTVFTFAEAMSRRWLPAGTALVLVGALADSPAFLTRFNSAIVATGYTPMILVRSSFVPAPKMPDVMAVASCAVLNTTSWNLSASGAVHAHAAHGVPMAVADRPIYTEAVAAGALPFEVDREQPEKPTQSAVCALAALASSPAVRGSVGKSVYEWAQRTRWSKLVQDYYSAPELYGAPDAA